MIPVPGHRAPRLDVRTLEDVPYSLERQEPKAFTMIVFYRGLHCPSCKEYLTELSSMLTLFAERGVEVIAVSMDKRERAETAAKKWKLRGFPIGYELDEATARTWGLFISKSIEEEEPNRFNEPGLFLVRPDGILHFAAINSMQFARPKLTEVLGAIDFILENQYPARGSLAA